MFGLCRPVPNQLENLQKLTRYAYESEGAEEPADSDEGSGALSIDAKQRMRELLETETWRPMENPDHRRILKGFLAAGPAAVLATS